MPRSKHRKSFLLPHCLSLSSETTYVNFTQVIQKTKDGKERQRPVLGKVASSAEDWAGDNRVVIQLHFCAAQCTAKRYAREYAKSYTKNFSTADASET